MIHVFVGPTLPLTDVALAGTNVRPPVRHGDLYADDIQRGDTLVIIDGVYHQAPALRHKEILHAMDRGVRVIGAASIGALRAAELAPLGMIGVGSIYTAYARGEIDGDDEVAVGQAPDGQWDALTWPLVNLRYVLALARAAAVLDEGTAVRLLRDLRTVYYPQRTTAAVTAVCRAANADEFAGWFRAQRARDAHFGNVKRTDALEALRAARGPWTPTGGPGVRETAYTRRWSNAFARATVNGLDLATEDRLVYQQVFDQHYYQVWAAYLDTCSRRAAEGRPGMPLSARVVEAGGALAGHQLFRPPVDLRDAETVRLLLAEETEQDRQAVARHAQALAEARRTRPGFSVDAVRDGLASQLLTQVWKCSTAELDAEASGRGLVSAVRAIEAAKRLVPGYLAEQRERRETAHAG